MEGPGSVVVETGPYDDIGGLSKGTQMGKENTRQEFLVLSRRF